MSLHLPGIHVADLNKSSFWENASYIPALSNVKGAANLILGTALLIAGVVRPILLGLGTLAVLLATSLLIIPFFPILVAYEVDRGFQYATASRPPSVFTYLMPLDHFFADTLKTVYATGIYALSKIARGSVESIPVAGNLALGFWDQKIMIY